jgi:hypothetical protein
MLVKHILDNFGSKSVGLTPLQLAYIHTAILAADDVIATAQPDISEDERTVIIIDNHLPEFINTATNIK